MIRRSFVSLAFLAMAFSASAQSLTTAQIATLRTNILADPVLAPKCIPSGDGPYDIAAAYKVTASPTFIVWKSSVSIIATGQAFNGAEWAGMTAANHTRLQTIAQYLSSYNPGSSDIRAMFNDIWSGAGGVTTRANLLALWKRNANRLEKLFATGTGSDASPAVMTVEGSVSVNDIISACGQ